MATIGGPAAEAGCIIVLWWCWSCRCWGIFGTAEKDGYVLEYSISTAQNKWTRSMKLCVIWPSCLPLQRHAIYTTPSPTSAFWDVFLSHTLFFSLSDSPLLLIILTHPSGVNSKAIPSERSFMMIPKLDQVPITNRLLQHDEMFPLYYFSNNTCFIHQIMPH